MSGDEMVTYRYADGMPVAGEYHHVTSLDFFETEGDYFEVIEERWSRTGVRLLKFGSLDTWCTTCDADVHLTEPSPPPVFCSGCGDRGAVS
jgi:hypothetical protein